MAADVGNQIVTLLYYTSASSSNVNKRFLNIRQPGIYQGGRLTIIDPVAKSASLSALVCEINDGSYQVRVETTTAVSITTAVATPYIVLRWTYTGTVNDYMEVLAVATPSTNDLVVAKCIFGGGQLTGFDYGDTSYSRTTPDTQNLFLKVEPTEDTELKVRVRAGRIQNASGNYVVVDQKSDLFTAPTANSKVYLVYIDTDDGTVKIDSTGTEAVSPTAPNYNGRLVIAEITLASTDTNITADKIKDVRNFITPSTADILTDQYLSTYNNSTQAVATGAFQTAELGTIKTQQGISVAANQITLTANRKYALSYTVIGQPTVDSAADPVISAKWNVISGDTNWNIEIVGYSSAECAEASRVTTQISTTCYIIPASTTVIELQVYTENTSQKAEIRYVITNIMSVD